MCIVFQQCCIFLLYRQWYETRASCTNTCDMLIRTNSYGVFGVFVFKNFILYLNYLRVVPMFQSVTESDLQLSLHPPAWPCRWWWMLCGRCGASQPASTTTSTPVPWRRGSTHWRTSSPSTSLWLQACQQASFCSWPTYCWENTKTVLTRRTSAHYRSFTWRMACLVTVRMSQMKSGGLMGS